MSTHAAARLRVPLLRSVTADWGGRIGLLMLAVVVLLALFGPIFAPHTTTAPVGIPGEGPTGSAPFGLDFLGRDVLSRVLGGGRSTLLLATAATALTYFVGMTIGLVAGYARSITDPLLI